MTNSKVRIPLAVAVIALVLSALPVLTLLLWPEAAQRSGLTEKLWYISTVLLGLGVALSLYALFSLSYALYSGDVLGGRLQLGGPAVLVLVFVILGFVLPPKPAAKFDVAVFLQQQGGGSGAAFSGTRLSMDLGADRRTETVDAKGIARFVGIPADFSGRKVAVSLDAPQYELPAGSTVVLTQEVVYLDAHWKSWQLHGVVKDESGQDVSKAMVLLAEQSVVTDDRGRFVLSLSARLPEAQRVLEVTQAGFVPWRNSVGMGTENVAVQLVRRP